MADSTKSWLDARHIDSVRIEGTNLDATLMGKVVSRDKFESGVSSGFNFADLSFGVDLQNSTRFGFAWPEWRGEGLDVVLRPDLDTLVEWAPGRASVIGDFHDGKGEPISLCPRNILKRTIDVLADRGYSAKVGIEIEATIFEESIHDARKRNFRNLTPLGGNAGFAYMLAKDDRWHEYMDAVSRRLSELGIPWEAWGDEAAVGQVEVNIGVFDPVTASDHWTRVRQVMREVAFQLDRTVTFMSKWSDSYGQSSHLNVSLEANGKNVFDDAGAPSAVMRNFIGGLVQTLPAAASLMLPWISSYRRLREFEGPPTIVGWGIANKSVPIRAVVGNPKQTRIEYRLPGSDANVYLALAAVLAAGAAGIEKQIEPPAPFEGVAWGLAPTEAERLPGTISQAFAALGNDAILQDALGTEFIENWIGSRRWEWLLYNTYAGDPDSEITDWEFARYFELS